MQQLSVLACPAAIVAGISYLLGSISFSILFTKLFDDHRDIRTMGSGNAGLTNVLRCVGIKAGIFTFLFDFSKGAAAVLAGKAIFQFFCAQEGLPTYCVQYGAYLAGIFCVIGHIYPVYFHFKGGKGVLASAAILFFLNWRIFLIAIAIFAAVFALTKIVSISSVCAALSFPLTNFLILYFFSYRIGIAPLSYVWITTLISFLLTSLLVYKHWANLERLKNGTEGKFSIKHP